MEINNIIMERDGYALIEIGEEVRQFAVVRNLNKEKWEWDYSCGYYHYNTTPWSEPKEVAFCKALDRFCGKVYGDIYASRHEILSRAEQRGILDDLLD